MRLGSNTPPASGTKGSSAAGPTGSRSPSSSSGSGTTSVRTGPSLTTLFSTHQALLRRGQAEAEAARATRKRLGVLERMGAKDTPRPGQPALSAVLAELERLEAELATHAALSQGVQTGQYLLRPSQERPFDLDIVPRDAPALAGLGVLPPLVAGAIALARIGAVVYGMYVAHAALKTYEVNRLTNLVEQGKDVSKVAEVIEPKLSTAAGVASVTTPFALAAGLIGAAYLLREWKKG